MKLDIVIALDKFHEDNMHEHDELFVELSVTGYRYIFLVSIDEYDVAACCDRHKLRVTPDVGLGVAAPSPSYLLRRLDWRRDWRPITIHVYISGKESLPSKLATMRHNSIPDFFSLFLFPYLHILSSFLKSMVIRCKNYIYVCLKSKVGRIVIAMA